MRLASHSDQAMQWLVWSQREQEVIASGELAGADKLHELQTWSADREIIALAPMHDCGLAELPMPKKNRRQAMAALPYMLEDDIAQDIDDIHVTITDQSAADQVAVCYVAHQKMDLWLSWLQQAELAVGKIVPDVLALPDATEQWQAVSLGSQWLIRQAPNQGVLVDDDHWLQSWWRQVTLPEAGMVSHTPWPAELDSENVDVELAELPLLALVNGAINSKVNLRHGDYRIRIKRAQTAWRPWLHVASLAAIALVLYLFNVALRVSELNHQADLVQAEVVRTYQIAFPNEKRVNNPRAQMRQKIKQIGGASGPSEGFLSALHDVAEAYRSVNGLEIRSLRFDAKRQELRIQASGKDFQQFEQFKSAVTNGYQAEVGALNSTNGQVSGTVTIRRVS